MSQPQLRTLWVPQGEPYTLPPGCTVLAATHGSQRDVSGELRLGIEITYTEQAYEQTADD